MTKSKLCQDLRQTASEICWIKSQRYKGQFVFILEKDSAPAWLLFLMAVVNDQINSRVKVNGLHIALVFGSFVFYHAKHIYPFRMCYRLHPYSEA